MNQTQGPFKNYVKSNRKDLFGQTMSKFHTQYEVWDKQEQLEKVKIESSPESKASSEERDRNLEIVSESSRT